MGAGGSAFPRQGGRDLGGEVVAEAAIEAIRELATDRDDLTEEEREAFAKDAVELFLQQVPELAKDLEVPERTVLGFAPYGSAWFHGYQAGMVQAIIDVVAAQQELFRLLAKEA